MRHASCLACQEYFQVFLTKASRDLSWHPSYESLEALKEAYEADSDEERSTDES